ncbi:MAG: TonB-dependent receptor plug domain-containing protein, partial [Chitinophagaceae bacterium]|nr:TonB-dependent receptor plug domain-containing protein [Chitinophagaceae bacterium]
MKRIFYQYRFLFLYLPVLLMFFSVQGYAIGQDILQRKVSLSLHRSTLESALFSLEKQVGVAFTYQAAWVSEAPLLSIRVREEPLSIVLDRLLAPTALEYRLVGGQIVLQKRQRRSALIDHSTGSLEGRLIRGRVTDEKSQGLQGVNVLVKGTVHGTETDAAGEFKLQISDDSRVLIFSYVGYETTEVAVAGQVNIHVSLKSAQTALSEVVVVGYGVQRKSDITGSVASVKMRDIEKAPSFRIDQSLQGRIAGVVIQMTDASPNAQTAVRIRGASSINGGNDPLVVIDGMQGGSLTTLSPADVASVEVLKDASATAIYGSRGANGVIIVTTKKGDKGKPIVGFNTYLAITGVRKKLDQMSSFDYALTVNANRLDYGLPEVFSSVDLSRFRAGAGTNWQDEIFRKGAIQNY